MVLETLGFLEPESKEVRERIEGLDRSPVMG